MFRFSLIDIGDGLSTGLAECRKPRNETNTEATPQERSEKLDQAQGRGVRAGL